MECALTNNQRINCYLNTQINRMVAKAIKTIVKESIREEVIGDSTRTQLTMLDQHIERKREVFQHQLQKIEDDTEIF